MLDPSVFFCPVKDYSAKGSVFVLRLRGHPLSCLRRPSQTGITVIVRALFRPDARPYCFFFPRKVGGLFRRGYERLPLFFPLPGGNGFGRENPLPAGAYGRVGPALSFPPQFTQGRAVSAACFQACKAAPLFWRLHFFFLFYAGWLP